MSNRLRALACSLLAAFSLPSGASEPPALRASPAPLSLADYGRPNLRIFTDKDGLPQNAISAVTFDREGYLWAGTKDGLARYDGRAWETVNLPEEYGSNWVQCLLVARDGALWVGTGGAGIARYSRGQWSRFTDREGLPGNEVFSLVESVSPSGSPVLFAATGKGLGRFEGGRWHRDEPIAGQPEVPVASLYETVGGDGRRTLWVGTNLAGVARLRDGAWTVYSGASFPAKGATSFLETTAVDGRPRLLAGTFGEGILELDGNAWKHWAGRPAGVPGAIVHSLHEVRLPDGRLSVWAGTGEGLDRFAAGRWVRFDVRQGFPPTAVWSLAQGDLASGAPAIWLGTAGLGLVQWHLNGWTSFDRSSGMAESSVYSIASVAGEDGREVLWVGTIEGGLLRFSEGRWQAFARESGLGDDVVWSIFYGPDSDGRDALFAGTNISGLRRYKDGRWTAYSSDEGLPGVAVTSLAPTLAADGSPALWVGTVKGIARLEHGRLVPPDPNLRLPEHRVRAILETRSADGEVTLWIGTDGGLARFERGRTTFYGTGSSRVPGDLPGGTILSLRERRAGRGASARRTLWVGTRAGVSLLDLDSPPARWTHLSTSTNPALPNNTVYRIEEDARGRVYLFTNKGVARLTPRTPGADDPALFSVYTYSTRDGLPSNECNTGASTRDSSGRIWAGTISGLAVLDPSAGAEATRPPPLRIQRAFLPGRRRPLRAGETLAHDENHVLFEFALLSFFREESTHYRTQLVGVEEEPSGWTTESSRNYFRLPSGAYRFRVWGRDAFGQVAGPAEVAFAIRPAPWRAWWAMILYAAAAAGAAWALFRVRVRALRRRTRELEAGIAERTAQLASTVEELRASEQRAHDANRAKTVFLANMSHELRTPLNAILGFTQLMARDRKLAAEHGESLRIVSRSGEHLLGLINDVLSVAKIEAGTTSVEEETFDFFELLRSVREMTKVRAEAKGLVVGLDLDPSLPAVVRGDEGKLRQVLVNLLGNAVKFTARGRVTLRVRWREGEPGTASFDVVDTGSGLTTDEMGQLFHPFVQTESGRKANEGTGLGLVISSNLVRLMGGEISVTSRPGEGSSFSFEIPLAVASHLDRRHAERPAVTGLAPGSPPYRILIADDTAENRLLLARLLEPLGFEVREAVNGADAVRIWESWRPHLIFMDMRMPVMDGIGATKRIRETDREVKIIALTASAFDLEQEFFLRAGCDAFVPKPFQTSAILDRLREHLHVEYVYESPEAGAASPAALTPEQRASLDPGIAHALREAMTAGDYDGALRLVSQMRDGDVAMARAVESLVRSYRFDEVLEWLEAERGPQAGSR